MQHIFNKLLFVVFFLSFFFFFYLQKKTPETHQFSPKVQFLPKLVSLHYLQKINKEFLYMLHVIHRNNDLLSKSSATQVTY